MRESAFLKQNEKKWKDFEIALIDQSKPIQPDKLADLFIELTNDLAYARTHYPNTVTEQYLNNLTSRVHLLLYKNKQQTGSRFLRIWTHDIPRAMARSQWLLLWSFLIFVIAILVGILSINYDLSFTRTVLGDNYVDYTERNFEIGDPLGIYGTSGEWGMFVRIALNNLRIDVMCFVMGIFFGLGSVYLLIVNGVMVGAFMGFLAKNGYLAEAFNTVMVHGTLELTGAVLAGAAGMALGSSLLFPKSYTRLESLQRGARRGMLILLGVLPVTFVAAIIESYVTRHADALNFGRVDIFGLEGVYIGVPLIIILLSFLFLIWYFVIYPLRLRMEGLGDED